MIRLGIFVEGETEQRFVRQVLQQHLVERGVHVWATQVGTPRVRGSDRLRKGGGGWELWRRDLRRGLGDQSPELRVTTMLDLYGLPQGFPGLDRHSGVSDTNERCCLLEGALAVDLGDRRLIPYLQRHEFEALVLSALPSLREILDADDDLNGLDRLEADISMRRPEDINDGAASHPSQRLCDRIPGYQKLVHGPTVIASAGLGAIRAACPRFNAWVSCLESLGQ